jgi:hypothetical protein
MNKELNFLMLFTSLFALTVITSCSKDQDDVLRENVIIKNKVNIIHARWEISHPDSKYASFEFNKNGNYIVIENDRSAVSKSSLTRGVSIFSSESFLLGNNKILAAKQKDAATRATDESNLESKPAHFGTYTLAENKIQLSGFGVLEAISVTTEEFIFVLIPEGTKKTEHYIARKVEELIPASNQADMLCRSWEIKKLTIIDNLMSEREKESYRKTDGPNWKEELENKINKEVVGRTIVLFSRTGTFLVIVSDGDESKLYAFDWTWRNKEETAFYYSWNRSYSFMQLTELTDTSLKMLEAYDYVETEFVPVNNYLWETDKEED